MTDRRRGRPPGRPATHRVSGPARIPEGGFRVDEATAAELVKFNAYLSAQRAIEAEERRVAKLRRAKDEAASRLRALNDDPKASREDREAAEAAYRNALAALDANGPPEAAEQVEAAARDGSPEPVDAAEPDTSVEPERQESGTEEDAHEPEGSAVTTSEPAAQA